MNYCRNPACPSPENPEGNQQCYGCGLDLSITPLFRNRYRVLKVLGQGSFGRTYGALDLDCMNRPCVIKKFVAQGRDETLEKAKELFTQEAQRLYELDHSQIPKLYAYFEQNDSLYLVQEYIQGQNLQKIYLHRGAFSEKQTLEILREILPVIEYIHAHGVLHRDIKPDNIMRRIPNKDKGTNKGELVLIDFGGAKQVTGSVLTGMSTAIYTPGYAAMEQMMGRPCKASDLYALGATCVRLLTGCMSTGILSGVEEDELYDIENSRWVWRERLEAKGITISQKLGKIFDKLLEPFVQNRYQSAQEVLAALNADDDSQSSQSLSGDSVGASGVESKVFSQNFQFELIAVDAQGKINKSQTEEVKCYQVDLGNDFVLEIIAIPGGKLLLGSKNEEANRTKSEISQQLTSLSSFWMSKYAITQEQWQVVMGYNPSRFKGETRPVEQISWYEAIEFCQKLSAQTGRKFRLPTEIEWEYACRAGTTTDFHFGATITTDLANYDGICSYAQGPKGEYRKQTLNVGSFSPNAFGLYNMHGNVREWCSSIWQQNYQGEEAVVNQAGENLLRILRGGGWVDHPRFCRSASRCGLKANVKSFFVGFRVVFG